MATHFNDPLVANQILTRVGEQWSEDVWLTHAYFESTKDWASQAAHIINEPSPQEKAADENLHTAEGQRYKAAVDQEFNAFIPACTREAGGNATGKFEVLLRVGKDGLVAQISTVGLNPVGSCLLNKIGESHPHSFPVFPQPPRPDYWVRYDLNLEPAGSVALK